MQPETHDSLKYQWRLYGLVVRSNWATGLDKAVAYEIIDRYVKRHANSRVSLRYLEQATGATRTNIIASLRRLCDRGPFSVNRQGAGTRPTEYRLHFENVTGNPSGFAGGTARDSDFSGTADDTASGPLQSTAEPYSGIVGRTESDLPVAVLQTGIRVEVDNVSAAPSAPPGSAADGPTGAVAAGFEAAWSAYLKHGSKTAARAAWLDISPEPTLAAHIAERAASWAASAKSGRKRMPFEKWLAEEKWDEADRRPAGATRRPLEVECYFVESDHMRVIYRGRRGAERTVRLVGRSADAVYDAVERAGIKAETGCMVIAQPGATVAPANVADYW